MPNGGDHSPERFAELERPLRSIETLVQCFAGRTGGRYMANYHEHPERRVTARRGRLVQCVCVSVVTSGKNFKPGPNNAAYLLWGGAWWDVADGRWWWHKEFAYWSIIPPTQRVEAEMRRAWGAVEAVRKRGMTFVPNPYKKHERTRARKRGTRRSR